jgi:hypothetical protein
MNSPDVITICFDDKFIFRLLVFVILLETKDSAKQTGTRYEK